MTLSDRIRHFFHVVSNIRPIVWIASYVAVTPLFALIYQALPDSQFRIPEGAGTDFGSWLYYSIVTITTLGFGDYTPAHGWAQTVTAIEVMCGLILLGFFLNAVGAMKSEIDVASEQEKQRVLHYNEEHEKLLKSAPLILHNLNVFMAYCYAVTTPVAERGDEGTHYNPDFTFTDMCDLYKPSHLPMDTTRLPAVTRMLKSLSQTSLTLDGLQNRVDLALWPQILEYCFKFVANCQMFSSEDALLEKPASLFHEGNRITAAEAEKTISEKIASWSGDLEFKDENELQPVGELYYLIKDNARLALLLEKEITALA